MVSLLMWVRTNQPELMDNADLRRDGIQFEADIIDRASCDISIKLKLTERVTETALGQLTITHVDEPQSEAAYQKLQRGAVTFDIDLDRGRADIYPEMAATVAGFKSDIDTTDGIVDTGNGGFTTHVGLESMPLGVSSAPESDAEQGAGIVGYRLWRPAGQAAEGTILTTIEPPKYFGAVQKIDVSTCHEIF